MSTDYSDMPLPPNWELKFDAASGHWFYINHEEKTTSWDDPRPEYYSTQQLDRLNTYRMGFGDRQDLIGEFFDIPESSPKSPTNSKSPNPKPFDDRIKDGSTKKTRRSRTEPREASASSRKNTHSKGRTISSHRNHESKSSACSQNDSESCQSSTYASPIIHKNLNYESLLSKTLTTDNDQYNMDDNVFINDLIGKVENNTPRQIDEEPCQIELSLEKHLDTNSPTNNNPLQSGVTSSVERQSSSINVSSINTNKIIDLFVCSTEKTHRYQPVGANPSLLLSSRIIPHGPNPLLVHGPNPSLVHGSIYQ